MGRPAFLIILELVVALPYYPAVLARRVPHLAAEKTAALSAYNFAGKNSTTRLISIDILSLLYLMLNKIKRLRAYDCRVAVFYIVLRDFTLINFHFLGKKIYCKCLLQYRIPFVLFILQNAEYRARLPIIFARWCWYRILGQMFRYTRGCLSCKKKPVDLTDYCSFLRHNFRQTILPFFIAEEPLIWHTDLAIGKSFALAPGDILRNAAAFFLCCTREHINNTPSISAKKYAHPDCKDAPGGAYLLAERCAR
jgi:hypothetical protein